MLDKTSSERMRSRVNHRIAWVVTLAVLAHLVVVVLHGQAHRRLAIELASWQQVYVIVVILLAPLVALVLSWTRYVRAGMWLLLGSMLGALIFGAVHHYIIISEDHVNHLPPGDARGLFRITALLLLVTETVGVIVAAMMARIKSKT
jgi:cytochrome bd-type quinol oxidase subunit 2